MEERGTTVAPPPPESTSRADDASRGWEITGADVRVVTSGGTSFPAHSRVLASASPVLENMLFDRPRKRGAAGNVVPMLGVPCDAVLVFLRCIYSSRCPAEDEMNKYGMHVLALSHSLRVPWLKKAATAGLAAALTADNVVDLLQLARQCDAPRLYVRCMNLVRKQFKAVEQTEGWLFVRRHDPWLELEILQFLQEADKREKRRRKDRGLQTIYTELGDAMECLRHICTDGCSGVGPRAPSSAASDTMLPACRWGQTCEGLRQLIRHFAACEGRRRRKDQQGGPALGRETCRRCASMWELLRLHSAVCDGLEPCGVPLCERFKEKATVEENKGVEDGRWRLLARKVVSAKVVSALSKRKREQRPRGPGVPL